MKIQPDKFDVQSVKSYGEGWVIIDSNKFTSSIIFSSKGELQLWPCKEFAQLCIEDFNLLAKFSPELVIIGTGKELIFPKSHLLMPLIKAGIGWEIMSTNAACRTYNILAQEGRHVLCAVIIQDSTLFQFKYLQCSP